MFDFDLLCLQASGCPPTPIAGVSTKSLKVILSDNVFPTVTNISGSLLAAEVLQGTKEVSFAASDLGSGIFDSDVLIDGNSASLAPADNNGGKCLESFEFLVPCLLATSFTHSIDTTQLSDGTHEVKLQACDAADNCGASNTLQIEVDNAPKNTVAPSVSGNAEIGAELTASEGGWANATSIPLLYSYRWLRCPASVTSAAGAAGCMPIVGATASTYAVAKADVGQRLMVRVTATLDAMGKSSSSAVSAPGDVVIDPNGGGLDNPPQTFLKKHPRKNGTRPLARFTFTSDQANAHFECKLDKHPFKPCRSPFRKNARRGAHVFKVRAVDSAGRRDRTPAVFRWRVSRP